MVAPCLLPILARGLKSAQRAWAAVDLHQFGFSCRRSTISPVCRYDVWAALRPIRIPDMKGADAVPACYRQRSALRFSNHPSEYRILLGRDPLRGIGNRGQLRYVEPGLRIVG